MRRRDAQGWIVKAPLERAVSTVHVQIGKVANNNGICRCKRAPNVNRMPDLDKYICPN
jgi:hypothetical protein